MKYNPDGSYAAVLVSENDLPVGLFDPSGAIRVTTDEGRGLYAPNGALRIADHPSFSVYTPDGALNGFVSDGGLYTPDRGGWSPLKLDDKLLAWWTADAGVSREGSGATSWVDRKAGAILEAEDGVAPLSYSSIAYRGYPGVMGDGSTKTLSIAPSILPSGDTPCEVWIVTDQQAPGTDTAAGVRRLISWGGVNVGDRRTLGRASVSNVNRANITVGTGSSEAGATLSTVDFSGPCVVRGIWTGTHIRVEVDGISSGQTAAVPTTGTTRTRLGANTANTPAGPYLGVYRDIVVTELLTTEEVEQLAAYLARRKDQSRSVAPLVSFGFITDTHWSSTKATSLNRYYQDAPAKIADAVDYFNSQADIAFVHHNGDLIDGDNAPTLFSDLADARDALDLLNAPWTLNAGNHDISTVSVEDFAAVAGRPVSYNTWDASGVRFIQLNANYYADDDAAAYVPGNNTYTDTFVPPAQRTQLAADLASASGPAVVFCHQLLDTDGTLTYDVNNAPAVREILEAAGNVVLVLSGHKHLNEIRTVNGITYVAMQAATEDAYPANAYAKVSIYSDSFAIEGFGNQVDR